MPTLIASTKVTPLGNTGGTTPAIDTTGADFVILSTVSAGLFLPVPTVSDNKGNVISNQGAYAAGTIQKTILWIITGTPNFGAGHTFSITGSFAALTVMAFSGIPDVLPEGVSGSGNAATASLQPGSLTAARDGDIYILGFGGGDAGVSFTVNSGFTIAEQVLFDGSKNYGCGIAYFVQSPAAALNPTVSATSGTPSISASMVVLRSVRSNVLTADHGSFTETGEAVSWGRGLILAIGSYVLTGLAAAFRIISSAFTAETGYFALTGGDAVFHLGADYSLDAMPGYFTLTGEPVKFCKAKAWPKADCSDSPWVSVRTPLT